MIKATQFFKVGVSIALLGVVAYMVDWREALVLVRNTPPGNIILALVLLLLAYLANGTRLFILQRRVGLDVPTRLFWGCYYTGLLMNYVLPSGVGGDVVRIVMLARRGYRAGTLVGSGLVDRFLGLLGLLMIAGLALLIVPPGLPLAEPLSRLLGVALVAGSTVGVFLIPRLGLWILGKAGARAPGGAWEKAHKAAGTFQRIFSEPGRMPLLILLSLSSHLFYISSYAVLGKAMLPGLTLTEYLFAIPGVMLLLMLPISLGGHGLREISTVGLLVWLGAGQQTALTLSLLFLAVSLISVIPAVWTAVHYGFSARTIKELPDG